MPCVGIDQRDWDRLSHEASAIYHCGGEVDYVKPYQSLHGANVSSTLELLRLATTASSKVLHYISTTFVFGFAVRDLCLEADLNLEMAGLNFGYAQTKWVSEQLTQINNWISGEAGKTITSASRQVVTTQTIPV